MNVLHCNSEVLDKWNIGRLHGDQALSSQSQPHADSNPKPLHTPGRTISVLPSHGTSSPSSSNMSSSSKSAVSPSVGGGAFPRDTSPPRPDDPCTICDGSLPPNPRLCGDCQSWDNFTHLTQCGARQHAQLDPSIFTAPRETDKADRGMRDDFPHTIKDLTYQNLDEIQSSRQCMVCRMKGDFFQELVRDTLSTQNPKFATWKPCAVTDVEPGVDESLTRVYPCLLPGAILSNEDRAASYTPVVLRLVLRYKGAGCSLDSVRVGTPQPIPSRTWLDG